MSDSLRIRLHHDSVKIYRHTSTRLFIKLENRYSPIANERLNMLGAMLGATFYERHSFFAGYFFMLKQQVAPFSISIPFLRPNEQTFLNMHYGLIGYQYSIVKTRFLHINLPFTAGFGKARVEYDTGNGILSYNDDIMPLSAGLQVILKPLNWLGASVSGGYRYIPQQQHNNLSLHGFYYSFGIWLDGRFISRHLRYNRRVRLHEKAQNQQTSASENK